MEGVGSFLWTSLPLPLPISWKFEGEGGGKTNICDSKSIISKHSLGHLHLEQVLPYSCVHVPCRSKREGGATRMHRTDKVG
jgi:hypothetical protein